MTIEEIKTIGTVIPKNLLIDVDYRCIHWNDLPSSKRSFIDDFGSYVTKGVREHNNEEHIIFEKEDYNVMSGCWMVPIREFVRLGIVKEESIIPENWCIHINRHDSNRRVITKYFNDNGANFNGSGGYYHPSFTNRNVPFECSFQVPYGYSEITFIEFEKYILNKKNTYNKDTKTLISNKSKEYSIDDIKDKLSKHYDDSDVKDILEIIEK